MSTSANISDDTYQTIASAAEGYFMDKRSKFYAYAFPVRSEEEIKEQLAKLKKQYFDATHHVYAWILGQDKSRFRANDDGEPSGSSAKPIYGQLLSHDLTNILIVVVRYFGGVKLGVPGLINAYRSAAIDVLQQATIVTKIVEEYYTVHFDYLSMNEVMKIIKNEGLEMVSQQFDNQCQIVFKIRQREGSRIRQVFDDRSGITLEYLRTE